MNWCIFWLLHLTTCNCYHDIRLFTYYWDPSSQVPCHPLLGSLLTGPMSPITGIPPHRSHVIHYWDPSSQVPCHPLLGSLLTGPMSSITGIPPHRSHVIHYLDPSSQVPCRPLLGSLLTGPMSSITGIPPHRSYVIHKSFKTHGSQAIKLYFLNNHTCHSCGR
jgi:hypothetical protein